MDNDHDTAERIYNHIQVEDPDKYQLSQAIVLAVKIWRRKFSIQIAISIINNSAAKLKKNHRALYITMRNEMHDSASPKIDRCCRHFILRLCPFWTHHLCILLTNVINAKTVAWNAERQSHTVALVDNETKSGCILSAAAVFCSQLQHPPDGTGRQKSTPLSPHSNIYMPKWQGALARLRCGVATMTSTV